MCMPTCTKHIQYFATYASEWSTYHILPSPISSHVLSLRLLYRGAAADPGEQVGAKLIKSVASKSDAMAGDGTTTSTLMTQVRFIDTTM